MRGKKLPLMREKYVILEVLGFTLMYVVESDGGREGGRAIADKLKQLIHDEIAYPLVR